MAYYHDGMRAMQDRNEGRAVPDRLAEHRMRRAFNDGDRAFIESTPFFFLATSSADSVDCSFKGGDPGFVRVVGDNAVAWPDYDGNRMYRSLGNISVNPRVGLLFINMEGKLFNNAARLRINGHAAIDESPEAIARVPGAKRIITVTAEHIFSNCPRYIPTFGEATPSVYTPRDGHTPPDPAWKRMDFMKDLFKDQK